MIRSIFLVLCLSLGFQSLSAQIIKDSSKSIRLNFGFPELQVEDDIQFQDQNDNNIIDPGEGGLISFTIKNVGKYFGVGQRYKCFGGRHSLFPPMTL